MDQNPYQNNQNQNQNPYQTPSSNMMTQQTNSGLLTIDEAISRGYDFDIGEAISEGWQATEGFKLNFFLAGLCALAILFVVMFVVMFIPIPFLLNIVVSGVSAVLLGGLITMCLNQLRGQQVEVAQLFSVKHLWQPLLISGLLVGLLTMLGSILLIIPGIYLAIAYGLVNWIIIEQPGVTFWEAMEGSRKIITQHWFKFFGLGIVLGLINMVAAIPLGIGLFWTAPLTYLAMGTVYRKIFEA